MGATRLSNLKPSEVSIVKRGANEQEFLIVKEDDTMDPTALEKVLKENGLEAAVVTKVAKALEPVFKTATEEAAMKAKADAEKDFSAKLEAEKKKTPADDQPVSKEDGTYDYSKVPAGMVTIWKEKHASDARAAKVEKQLADERDVRITKEFALEAAGYKHLGVKTEDLATVLKEVAVKAPEAAKLLTPIFKGLDEKIAKGGLFTEHGTSTSGGSGAMPNMPAGSTEAEAKIETIAKGLVEKDGKLTKEQAIAKAWSDNRELYNQHLSETDARKKRA